MFGPFRKFFIENHVCLFVIGLSKTFRRSVDKAKCTVFEKDQSCSMKRVNEFSTLQLTTQKSCNDNIRYFNV